MREEINVDMLEEKVATAPDLLYACGGPCIIVGVYDPTSKTGYMTHDPGFVESKRLKRWLKDIIDAAKHPAGGGSMDFAELEQVCVNGEEDIVMESRKYVERTLRERFRHVDIDWAPCDSDFEISLDTKKGRFERDYQTHKFDGQSM